MVSHPSGRALVGSCYYKIIASSRLFSVLHGKIMRQIGVEVIGMGALKLTGFLKELMQQNGVKFDSLYTVRTLKEVIRVDFSFMFLSCEVLFKKPFH